MIVESDHASTLFLLSAIFLGRASLGGPCEFYLAGPYKLPVIHVPSVNLALGLLFITASVVAVLWPLVPEHGKNNLLALFDPAGLRKGILESTKLGGFLLGVKQPYWKSRVVPPYSVRT